MGRNLMKDPGRGLTWSCKDKIDKKKKEGLTIWRVLGLLNSLKQNQNNKQDREKSRNRDRIVIHHHRQKMKIKNHKFIFQE